MTAVHRIFRVAVLAVASLTAGLLRADTIILKVGDETSAVEGTVESVDARELTYTPASTDRKSRKPIDAVLQIKAPKEPELTAAEQAYADGKWADAVTKYQSALKESTTEWGKYRALIRLIDAAAKDKQFAPQVAAFIELARSDPANAQEHQPELNGVKSDQMAAAIDKVDQATEGPGLKLYSYLALSKFLTDLNLARKNVAGGGGAAPATAPVDFGSGAIGPRRPEFDRQIIFVCDGSASMGKKAATLKDELQKAVAGLRPIQAFNIIFLQSKGYAALDTQLVVADNNAKLKAYKFLDGVTFSGAPEPIPGLTLAFEQHPQLLYLLTDGDFPDNKAVKEKIAELNKDHKVKISTIAFVAKQDTDTDFLKLLEEIAKDNGGTYKHLNENELK